jgi:hypothetical protein
MTNDHLIKTRLPDGTFSVRAPGSLNNQSQDENPFGFSDDAISRFEAAAQQCARLKRQQNNTQKTTVCNDKVRKSFKLMNVFLGNKNINDDQTLEEKYQEYLRQRQKREAMQLHSASKQTSTSDNNSKVIKSYRLMSAVLNGWR